MRILFLSYWGLYDGLTSSTVFPHLEVLQARPDVEAILFVSLERDTSEHEELFFNPGFHCHKITFNPLYSKKSKNVFINKINDFYHFPRELERLTKKFNLDFTIARGANAGALAYLLWKKTKLPFYVESFEPHADYMLESGVWKQWDPRYIFQKYWEKRQKQLAVGIMPVSENYRHQLIEEGVSNDRIVTVPCSVDMQKFAFNSQARKNIRFRLGFTDTEEIVGIYVGKFGGIYYDDEAFGIFKSAADHFGSHFRLIILTPHLEKEIWPKLEAVGFQSNQYTVKKVSHAEVADYLSASDFAFAPIRPAPSRLFCSAIKIGEYWANGLPILLTPGVGDDSAIIECEGGGAIIDVNVPGSVKKGLARIAEQILEPNYRSYTKTLALKYRNNSQVVHAYEKLLPPNSSIIAYS